MLSLYELKKILNPKQDSTPEDDFRIIQSWAEYDEKSSKPPEEKKSEISVLRIGGYESGY